MSDTPKTMDYDFSSKMIDGDMTLRILEKVNRNFEQASEEKVSLPDSSYEQLVRPSSGYRFKADYQEVEQRISELIPAYSLPHPRKGRQFIELPLKELKNIGMHLLPFTAYGLLNGGAATSYIDRKKNSSYFPPLLDLLGSSFTSIAAEAEGKSKALTPAYMNPDGSPGFTFLEMKMRSILVLMVEARRATGTEVTIPLFEMRNPALNKQLEEACDNFRKSPALKDLIEELGYDVTRSRYRLQELTAAFTHSSEGSPRRLFTEAFGQPGELLALPGGHGLNFAVLRPLYEELHANGYRFSTLVNIDNMGNFIDPVHLALTFLTGSQASFEFSVKTPLDRKGGVLALTPDKHPTCVDIGVAVSYEEIEAAEAVGKNILFNCATGLFDLDYLTAEIDTIIENLPIRLSDQEKDAGRYSQAEQITWEVINLIPKPLIIAVDKPKRFIAAKLLSELLATSLSGEIVTKLESIHPEYHEFCTQTQLLHDSLEELLSTVYGMKLSSEGKWVPKTVSEL